MFGSCSDFRENVRISAGLELPDSAEPCNPSQITPSYRSPARIFQSEDRLVRAAAIGGLRSSPLKMLGSGLSSA